jgi:prepilin-type N-terminal cleavage/methylation domain-containing protein
MIDKNEQTSSNEAGFTLLEMIAALLIFSLVLGGLAPVIVAQAKRNTSMEIRAGALGAAQRTFDELRIEEITGLPTSGTWGPEDVEVNGRTYQVTTEFCSVSTYCSTVNNRHVSVTVRYKNEETFSAETVFTQLN